MTSRDVLIAKAVTIGFVVFVLAAAAVFGVLAAAAVFGVIAAATVCGVPAVVG